MPTILQNLGLSCQPHLESDILTVNQKTTRAALNISGFKKSASRTTSFGAGPAEFETATGGGPRSAAKGAARIYAPHPSTPPVIPPLPGFPTPEFKTPSLPFSRSVEDDSHNVHTSPGAADVTNIFRPKSCRPQQQGDAQTYRPPPPPPQPSHERSSFFGNVKFPFDSPSSAGDLDDSGYFSEHAADDTEVVDRFGSAKRNDNRVGANPENTRFAKRGRPASPGNDDEDIGVMAQQQSNHRPRDLPKRPCVRRASSPSRSRAPPSTTAPMLESRAPDAREGAPARAFILPPHIPHPMAAMGELPGLEFSEADLARYAELYGRGSERWSKAPMEEWVAGADDILAKFGDMIDMVSRSPSLLAHLFGFPTPLT
jgi:hypothetical protein